MRKTDEIRKQRDLELADMGLALREDGMAAVGVFSPKQVCIKVGLV